MEQSKKVTIRPTGTSLSGVTNAGNGKVKVTWLRNKSATGYRIQYSTDSKFKRMLQQLISVRTRQQK